VNKKHLFAVAAVAGLGLFFWLRKKKSGSGRMPQRIINQSAPQYAGPVVVPGSESGNAPLSHFASLGAMNLDNVEDYAQ
jgi:hypothetical protein